MNAMIPFCRITADLHSAPLGLELTEKLITIATRFGDGEEGCHGLDHARRVHRTALYIGERMAAHLNILSAASLLHDIGRRIETEQQGRVCHAAKGAEMAESILKELNFSVEDIDAITHCIATHRYRDGKIPESKEACILFDADKLDSIGATGIGRAFLFAGQIGARLHNDTLDITGTSPYTTEDTAYREFRVKMSRLKDRMLTPIGRELAIERHNFMECFFRRLEWEIRGDWEQTPNDSACCFLNAEKA